jgi:peptide-methionine (S)-S-oxide reductase
LKLISIHLLYYKAYNKNMTTYVLGGGCFWCLDAIYRHIRGVLSVESGYAGGEGTPDYYRVASGSTSYAEVVRVTFDPKIIPPDIILDMFFLVHNPTTLNRQGADVGTQYRSSMFYTSHAQKEAFLAAISRAKAIWDDPIATEITPLDAFFVAEDEHQDYFNKNPERGYCSVVIEPKISKARAAYTSWFKEE